MSRVNPAIPGFPAGGGAPGPGEVERDRVALEAHGRQSGIAHFYKHEVFCHPELRARCSTILPSSLVSRLSFPFFL